jgi:type VI secretion system protein ImpL
LFGYGGLFDAFFNENLGMLVDTSRSPWTWRPGALSSSRGMLAQFEAAQGIRELFFRQGSLVPDVDFTVMITDRDPAATRFILEIDGQRADDVHGASRRWPAKWPASNPGMAAATFEDRFGSGPSLKFDGPWAWFRLIDASKPQQEPELRVGLSFEIVGHRARVTVGAASIRNPFTDRGWQRFSCGL